MFILEGTIGAGKSTFARLLTSSFSIIKTVNEPLDLWDSTEHQNSLLSQYMSDPHRWSCTMEIFTLMCRFQDHQDYQENKNAFLLSERSLFSGHYVFAVNGNKQGFFSPMEWAVYESYFSFFVKKKSRAPEAFIYLRADPEVALERVRKRNRPSEKLLSLDYLKQLHDRHEEFLVHKKDVFDKLKKVPVLVLDGNIDFENDVSQASLLLEKTENFLKKHANFSTDEQR